MRLRFKDPYALTIRLALLRLIPIFIFMMGMLLWLGYQWGLWAWIGGQS